MVEHTGVTGEGTHIGVLGICEKDIGVLGQTKDGRGIYGTAYGTGRGGLLTSSSSAQLLLSPQNRHLVDLQGNPIMPKDGKGGDIMCIIDSNGNCSLYFCVESEVPAAGVFPGIPARWARVLLGPPFEGGQQPQLPFNP